MHSPFRTDPLEQQLRNARPEPPTGLTDRIQTDVDRHSPSQHATPRHRAPRMAAGLVIAVVGLAALGASGGIGYAKSVVTIAAVTTKHSLAKPDEPAKPAAPNKSFSAAAEVYFNAGFYCMTRQPKPNRTVFDEKFVGRQQRLDNLLAKGWVVVRIDGATPLPCP